MPSHRSAIAANALYAHLQKDLSFVLNQQVEHESSIPLDVKQFAAKAMLDKFLSKLVPESSYLLDRAAYISFASANQRCKAFSIEDLCENESSIQLWGEFLKIVEDFFISDLGADCELSWGNISLNARSGPGAAVGSRGTSHYEKFYSGPIACTTPSVLELFRADNNLWPESCNAENIRELDYGEPRFVQGSRTSFVPKTVKTSRMICVEPAINMYYQLGLGEIITKRLKRFFGIDLSSQPDTNRYLAYLGSLIDSTFGDGYATIDLTSASDCISLGLCSAAIPQDWLSAMLLLRSPVTEVTLGNEKFSETLNMMSTMGNGFTFPLQTALFACAAAACVSLSDDIRSRPFSWSERRPGGLYSVFGDDIVVISKVATRLTTFLGRLGFIPSETKCFTSGMFRESCGHDYYRGHNVRPVFVRKLKTRADLVVLTNLLVDWSARTQVPIDSTLKFLLDRLSKWGGVYLVPMEENHDAGVRVPLCVAKSIGILKRDPHVQAIQYPRWVPVPWRYRISEAKQEIAGPRGRRLKYKPSGLHLSYLRGEIRSCCISIRLDGNVQYRTKQGVSSRWDWYRPSDLECRTGHFKSFADYANRVAWVFDGVLKPYHVNRSKRRLRRN